MYGTTTNSTYIKSTRRNLFDKIDNEIANFTPYEKFLYFDAQNNSTSSAPGIGKNYAATTALNLYDSGSVKLTNHDGFNTVYKLQTNKDNYVSEIEIERARDILHRANNQTYLQTKKF